MIGDIQVDAQKAMIAMENSLRDEETGLRMAEAASNDKTELQESMRRLFTTLGQINDGTARQSDGIAEFADPVEGLGNAIRIRGCA
ncbi:MAG: hypothetical protein P3W87_005850 [Gammaproteobacteria bacterium]|nr:hypothetical protein [Gammaproteobacteria bacterium]